MKAITEERKTGRALVHSMVIKVWTDLLQSILHQYFKSCNQFCRYVQDATLNSMERSRRFGSFYSWTEKRSFGIVPRETGLSREGGTSNSSFSCCLFVELRLIRLEQLRVLRGPREERKKRRTNCHFSSLPDLSEPTASAGISCFSPSLL